MLAFRPRVRKLNANFRVLAVCKFKDASERLYLRVFPEPRVFGGKPAFWYDSCGFGHGKTGPARNDSAEVGKMPGSVMAVLGEILAKE